jgi:hypothetical protein
LYLFNGHYNLNGVKAIQAQVVREVCRGFDLHETIRKYLSSSSLNVWGWQCFDTYITRIVDLLFFAEISLGLIMLDQEKPPIANCDGI